MSASTNGAVFGPSRATYTYYDPSVPAHVSSVSPAAGSFQQPMTVTIFGSNFAPTDAGLRARWGHLGLTRATFINSSVALATTSPAPSTSSSLSVPVEVSFSNSFDAPPPAEAEGWYAPALFTYYNPFYPPKVVRLSPSSHACDDGGSTLVDVRSGKQLETSSNAAVEVTGENFAPLPRLSCVYRRTGESIFDHFDAAVPAIFASSTRIICPIPSYKYADDGLTLSSKMFFSVSNDGETYRYESHTFTYVGGCKPNKFTSTMYSILGGLLALIAVGICLVCTVWTFQKDGVKVVFSSALQSLERALGSLSSKVETSGASRPAQPTGEGWQVLQEDEEATASWSTRRPSPSKMDTSIDSGAASSKATLPRATSAPSSGPQAAATRRMRDEGDLEVHIVAGHALLATELTGSDPYVVVQPYGAQPCRTKVIPKELEPVWNEKHRFRGTLADFSEGPLVLKVRDWDGGPSTDEPLGELHVDLTPLVEADMLRCERMRLEKVSTGSLTFSVAWIPPGSGTSESAPAGMGGIRGILHDSEVATVPEPAKASCATDVGQTAQAQPFGSNAMHTKGVLEVFVISAQNLRPARLDGHSDPYVTVKVPGRKPWKTSVQSKTLQPMWQETMYVPDVALADVLGQPMVLRVEDRMADPTSDDALGVLNIRLDGLVTRPMLDLPRTPLTGKGAAQGSTLSLKVSFSTAGGAFPTSSYAHLGSSPASPAAHIIPTDAALQAAVRSPPKVPAPLASPAGTSRRQQSGTLEIHLRTASNLMPADAEGFSDPYVTLKVHGHKTWRSSVQQKTLNPTWDEMMRVHGVLGDFLQHSLHLKCFDKDFLGMGDDRLGSARVSLDELDTLAEVDLPAVPLREAASGTISLVARFTPDDAATLPSSSATLSTGITHALIPPPLTVPSHSSGGSIAALAEAARQNQQGTLEIHLREAAELVASSADAYVMIKLPGQHYWKESARRKNTGNPQWDERIQVEGVLGDFTLAPMQLKIMDSLGRVDLTLEPLKEVDTLDFNARRLLEVPSGTLSLTVSWIARRE